MTDRPDQAKPPVPARPGETGLPAAGRALGSAVALLGLLLVVAATRPGEAAAQGTVPRLTAQCGTEWCTEVALAAQAARADFGLLAAGGDPIPGSAGTLGFRLNSIPRISVAASLGAGRVPMPDLGRTVTVPLRSDPFFARTVGISGAVGIFGGLSPLPTVGGLLSLDVLGSGSVVFLPSDRGFDGSASTYGLGFRVGIFRESFTLPGVAVSVMKRWGGRVTLTGRERGTAVPEVNPVVTFDPSTTSVRATVGKDFLAVGLLGGVGWDRYDGSLSADPGYTEVLPGSGTTVEPGSTTHPDTRFLVFGGAAMNFLILDVSAELGWARGMDSVAGRPSGGFDPTDSSWFGNLAVRLTY